MEANRRSGEVPRFRKSENVDAAVVGCSPRISQAARRLLHCRIVIGGYVEVGGVERFEHGFLNRFLRGDFADGCLVFARGVERTTQTGWRFEVLAARRSDYESSVRERYSHSGER